MFRPRSAGRRHLAPRGDGLRRLRRRLVGRREVSVDDGVPGVHRVAGGERLAVLVGQLRDGRRRRAAALLERVRHTDLRTHSHRSDIANERVPKITINHTINLFLLTATSISVEFQTIAVSECPGPHQQTRRSSVRRPNDATDRRTDRGTPDKLVKKIIEWRFGRRCTSK